MSLDQTMPCVLAIFFWFLAQTNTSSAQSGCLNEQKVNLLQLRNDLQYSHTYSTKLANWNEGADCCKWPGISCNSEGAVVALDLNDESITDGLDHSDAFVNLTSLQSLDLSNNFFIKQRIPPSVHKLTALRSLHMASTNLSGPINESLANIRFLEELHLDGNYFQTPIPLFFANFTSMKEMQLNESFWIGEFPEAIFHMKSLEFIRVSGNKELTGTLPEFHPNSSIQYMILSGTKFGGIIPHSIVRLPLLKLRLSECQFVGEIPRSVFNMTQLVMLELQNNNLTGIVELDWIANLPNFAFLSLANNSLTVKANTLNLDQLTFMGLNRCNMERFPFLSNQSNLAVLSLNDNYLEGPLPSSLPPTLVYLDLSQNNFTSSIPADLIAKLPSLRFLLLVNNNLDGEIPSSLCNALQLESLMLSGNNLSGSIPECLFRNLKNLITFAVARNHMSGSIPDTFHESCMVQFLFMSLNSFEGRIPESLGNCKRLEVVHLDNNKISGTFPCQLKGSSALDTLNLLRNLLHGDINCVGDWPNLQTMTLMFNKFTGFTAFGNATSMSRLKSLFSISLLDNRLEGTIPSALCSLPAIQQLDLGGNRLHGPIPGCLMSNLSTLKVLGLHHNSIGGSIPNEFQDSCGMQSLLMMFNLLEGPVPQSLAKCAGLEVFDLSHNKMKGFFPCHLKNSSNLKVVNLRSNQFHGGVECIGSELGDWRSLRIIDISHNQFSGILPSSSFASWNALITDYNSDYGGLRHGTLYNKTHNYPFNKNETATSADTFMYYYYDEMTVATKGSVMQLGYIAGAFSAIDFSSNQFSGPIPESIGLLSAIHSINLSHNAFSGPIPSLMGNLSNLESLDLSNNHLSGNIPTQLSNLPFLQLLDVSTNQLEGRIPTGTQMQTFPASSFEGNKGLYGPPLKDLCSSGENSTGESCNTAPSASEQGATHREHIDWYLESAAAGFLFGVGLILCSLILVKSWRVRYSDMIDSFVSNSLKKT